MLDQAPTLADKLYAILFRDLPVPEDIAETLKRPRSGNGGNGGDRRQRGETAAPVENGGTQGPDLSAIGF